MNRRIHHLDSSPPLSFLIIKDKDKNNSDSTNKPIVQNAGRFKKVQITIINGDNEDSSNNNNVNSDSNNIVNNNNNVNSDGNNDVNNDKLKENEEDSDKLCKTCNKQFSLYTCPRCNINYCSLLCFKSHNSKCSTEFFEQQLSDNLKNIDKVSPKDSLAFLKRMKEIYDVEDSKFDQLLSEYNLPKDVSLNQLNQFSYKDNGEGIENEEEEQDDEDRIDLDGLNLDEMTEEELLSLLSKEEIEEFNKSIKDGSISNLIEEWIPWWQDIDAEQFNNNCIGSGKIQELNQSDNNDILLDQDTKVDKEENEAQVLLSRIPKGVCNIQPFSKLTNNKPPSKALYFHLVDILYCYCFLMRTFNGEWGLKDISDNNNNNSDSNNNSINDTLLEGCKLILDLSTVLKPVPTNKQDLKLYQSHLSSLSSVENVINNLLNSSHNNSIENNNNKGNIYFSLFLLQDVISILNNHRFILSSISHLYNSFKSSIDILKSNFNNKIKELQQTQLQQQQEEIKSEYQLLSSCFENISKKLQFFLSWINEENKESFILLSNQVSKYFENEKSILATNSNK